jgi:hypothetical protein
MINDLMNNLQIKLLKGSDSFISFALSKKFDEHLSLPWSGRRIWEELEYELDYSESIGRPVAGTPPKESDVGLSRI